MSPLADVGVVGLGVMGQNLALNLERRGWAVCAYDNDPASRSRFAQRCQGTRAWACETPMQLVAGLSRPRRLLIMVPAGKAVDQVLDALRPLLQDGDVVMDGGNSHYRDTQRRLGESAGLHYVGLGVSGGEQGALWGPALMPGGDPRAWPLIEPLLDSIAARAEDGQACCSWMGSGGSGHFVKMVHNGIEYAEMQALCEAYALMGQSLGMTATEMADAFERWNEGPLSSYLVEITARILRHPDRPSGQALVDLILDTAEQKGTGQWTGQSALELGVPAPTLAQAVFARSLSALKDQRLSAARVLPGPSGATASDRPSSLERLGQALMAARLCSYAQGFALLRAADAHYGWQMKPQAIASNWRAGCIIRARLLGDIAQAFERTPDLEHLLLDEVLSKAMGLTQLALREVVAQGALSGIALPALMGSLAYYDALRCQRLPANLLQAQRDFFGAHGYRRIDQPGVFHTDWPH